jgi:HD-GYP domain-containing protein (c-di-GMP phosphodiesterase class II)
MPETKSDQLRPVIHYLAILLLIGIYGIQVCPFIESLTPLQLATPLLIIVAFQYLLRSMIAPLLVGSAGYKLHVTRSFQLELGLFVLSGLLLTASNSILYDFPIESGLKMILGFSTLGFFAATDLALQQERRLASMLREKGITLTPDSSYFPLVGKFTMFAAISTLFMVGIFFLLINKDLEWLMHLQQGTTLEQAQHTILAEFAFVGLVLLGYMLNTIYSYSRNLNYFFSSENQVLAAATGGNLSTSVTVSSNDEFGEMAHHTNTMIERLCQRTRELQRTQDVTILGLASLAETRDNETGAHIMRTQRYVRALAEELQGHPGFSDYLDQKTIDLLYKSAPLHDIGKVGIPDSILLKPGKLTDEEFVIMRTHADLGGRAIEVAEERLGCSTGFLQFGREIATSHHEKWDGSGYPQGLRGSEIPISGRLMAVADVYDALISKRVYKPAFPHTQAMQMIHEGSGKHFDPEIVAALDRIEDEIIEIAARYGDKVVDQPQ